MSLKSVGSCLKSRDFFGIASITTKDISGSFSRFKLPHHEISDKYRPLIRKRKSLANEVIERDRIFGKVRVDSDNAPRFHGQFEPDSDRPMYNTIDIKQFYVKESNEQSAIEQNLDVSTETSKLYPDGPRVIDVLPEISLTDILDEFKADLTVESLGKYDNKPPLVFEFRAPVIEESELKLSGHQLNESEIAESVEAASKPKKSKLSLVYEPEKDKIPFHELEPTSEEYFERSKESLKDLEFDKSLDEKFDVKEKKPSKGSDYLKEVRAQRVEPTAKGLKHRLKIDNPYSFGMKVTLDSQGFKNYSGQVPDWRNYRHVELLDYLKKSIIYHNYDILAVNKPYGIASHCETMKNGGDSENIDLNRLMHEIAATMKIEKLFLAHRLDKTTTGVLLFATSQARANNLNKLFKSDQIKKTYWCITNGVPTPASGIIDIPISEHRIAGKSRSCLAPERTPANYQLTKKYAEARRAITEYRVLEQQQYAALVEVKPRTGVKHQIRCHMSFGLGNPILGDHKYGHIDKIAPQSLTKPLLKLFHLRPQKVRTLPTHLHARTIVIPGAKANGETLFITAPLAPHFKANLKTLKLKPDDLE